MKFKLTNKIIGFLAGAFTFFALSTSASACIWSYYQPKEPKCLQEK